MTAGFIFCLNKEQRGLSAVSQLVGVLGDFSPYDSRLIPGRTRGNLAGELIRKMTPFLVSGIVIPEPLFPYLKKEPCLA